MKDERPPDQVKIIMNLRRYIETVIGKLVETVPSDRSQGKRSMALIKQTVPKTALHTHSLYNSTAQQGSSKVETRVTSQFGVKVLTAPL